MKASLDSLKGAATTFLTMVIANDVRGAFDKFVDPNAISHNPYSRGTAKELMKAMEENGKQMPNKIFEIKHVVAEGDLVAVHSHLKFQKDQPGMAVVHLLRFNEQGKIVEFWDVGQQIPENSPNEKGMF